MVKVLQEEIEDEGVSVVIPRRECIVTLTKKKKEKKKEKTEV